MKLVIDIPKERYNRIISHTEGIYDMTSLLTIIESGTSLPKGHGRLIDADKMTGELLTIDSNYACMADWCLQVVDAQPTVIEEDKEDAYEDVSGNV